jgi:hypothetical protein
MDAATQTRRFAWASLCGVPTTTEQEPLVDLREAIKEAKRLSNLLEAGLDVLRSTAQELAEAEREYRKGKALAWVNRTQGTAAERAALVDSDTADLRYVRDLKEGMRRAALESVRARSQQISMLQTLVNAHKSEGDFASRQYEEAV